MGENRLEDETALVTGGTDGIGKAIARRLAARGAEVFLVGSDPEKGGRAERDLRATGGHDRVHFLQADLSLMMDTDRLADDVIAGIPKLHRLVLCAGVDAPAGLSGVRRKEWIAVHADQTLQGG